MQQNLHQAVHWENWHRSQSDWRKHPLLGRFCGWLRDRLLRAQVQVEVTVRFTCRALGWIPPVLPLRPQSGKSANMHAMQVSPLHTRHMSTQREPSASGIGRRTHRRLEAASLLPPRTDCSISADCPEAKGELGKDRLSLSHQHNTLWFQNLSLLPCTATRTAPWTCRGQPLHPP